MSRDGGGGPSRYEVVTTTRGARAMRDVVLGEIMHPVVGGAVEAEGLYALQSRLRERLLEETPRPLVLFDAGLGAASNALAARRVSESLAREPRARRLELVSFERDTGSLEVALRSENAESFGLTGEPGDAARALLSCGVHESARTRWRLRQGDLVAALALEETRADVVFWDPFSPRANPGLWTVRAFAALRARSAARCTVFTYSAATSVRSALLLAGFTVGIGAGTGTTRETTAAAVDARDLERPLTRLFVERLARSSAPFPTDAPQDALGRIERMEQFEG